MSSTYNAITNLQEIEMDSLIVNLATIDTALIDNLDCNVGVIDTLSSTTATLTSANIPTLTSTTAGITTANITTENTTTSNTTNLNTNNIQANPASSAVSLYTSGTGGITLGNNTNLNNLNINLTTLLQSNKNLQLSGTGKVITPSLRVTDLTAGKLVLTDATTNDFVSSSYAQSDLAILSNNNTFTGNNTFNGNVLANTLRGTSVLSAISLYSTTTGGITIGGSSSGITLSDNVSFSGTTATFNPCIIKSNTYTGLAINSNLSIGENGDTGTLTIYKTTSIPSSTISGTLSVNDIQGTTTSSPITLFTLSSVSSPTITLGNVSGGDFSINPNTTMNGNLTLASGKTITLNSTGGKVICNSFQTTSISSPASLFTELTGNSITIGNLSNGNALSLNMPTIIGTGRSLSLSSTGQISCNTIQGTSTSSAITLFTNSSVSSPSITLGNASGGNFNINPNVVLGSSKNLTFTNGTLLVNTITGQTTGSNINLFGTSTANITLGNVSNTGDVLIQQNLLFSSGKKLKCSTLTTSVTSGALEIGETGDTGIIRTRRDLYIGSTPFSSNKGIYCNYFDVLSGADNIIFCATQTTGSISIQPSANGSTGNIFIGNSSNPSLDTSSLFIYKNTTYSANKTITLNATGGKVLSNVYTGTATSSNLTIGESGNTGTLTIYKTTTFSGGDSTFGTIITDTINATASNSTATLFGNITNGSVSIAGGLTDGNLLLGFAQRNFGIRLGSPSFNSVTDTGYIDLLLPVRVQYDITMSTTNKIFCNSYQGRTSNSNVSLFTETSGATNTITIGNTSASTTTINTPVVLATGKNLTLSSSGKIVVDSIEATSATASINALFNNLTTGSINALTSQTTGGIVFGSSSGTTTGLFRVSHKMAQRRQYSGTDYNNYWNVGQGKSSIQSSNPIFQSSYLSALPIPAIYTNAENDVWSVWESDAQSEGSFFAQNGNTSIICNPGDNFAFHWQDEDSMPTASGFKFATNGVMSTTSDRRLKRDINPIPVAPDLLDKLSLIEYVNYKRKAPTEEKYYKNGKLRQKYQDIHKGLIAQDVKKIFPEVVEKDGEYHMMKYQEVDIYFNMGVQELIKRDKEKQIEIDAQKTLIDDLTTRLARLEQLILNP